LQFVYDDKPWLLCCNMRSKYCSLFATDCEETPGTTQDTVEGLHLCERLGIPQNELESVAGERKVYRSACCCHGDPPPD